MAPMAGASLRRQTGVRGGDGVFCCDETEEEKEEEEEVVVMETGRAGAEGDGLSFVDARRVIHS